MKQCVEPEKAWREKTDFVSNSRIWTKTFKCHWYHEDTSHYLVHSSKHYICLSQI